VNETREENRLHLEGGVTCATRSDIIVQKYIRAGEEAEIFTEIQNVRCESKEGDEKDNKKKRFPFMG
jgi:hypothetical protein